jgi:hypothetical protein
LEQKNGSTLISSTDAFSDRRRQGDQMIVSKKAPKM